MPRSPSPAQIANQVTFLLKGDLKNARIAYIRAAVKLARVRDERLWRALEHRSLEDYAAKRLGLQKTPLYRYLRIHDWLRRSHPAWLARRPKGFIPELSDADALMWLENRLDEPHLSEALRQRIEGMRRKALTGDLTEREFRELRAIGRQHTTTLRALLARLRSLRRFASRVTQCPERIIAGLDMAITAAEAALGAAHKVVRLHGMPARFAVMSARLSAAR